MRQKIWKDRPEAEILAEVKRRRRRDMERISIRKAPEIKRMEREE